MPDMRGAFVIQLEPESNPSAGRYTGRVEEVDSGKESTFGSLDELLTFLAERFTAPIGDERTPPIEKTEMRP
jgi:hypothetical protein